MSILEFIWITRWGGIAILKIYNFINNFGAVYITASHRDTKPLSTALIK